MRTWWKVAVSAGWLTVAMALATYSQRAAAQSGCLSGKVSMAFGVNGTVTVCPQYDAKVPELQKQLNEMQKTLSGNQALLREVTRSARSVNSLGRDVDENRQVELLRNFNKELQKVTTENQQKTQEQIAELADKLAMIQDLLTQKKEDEKTAPQTQAALSGPLGDALAKLDLTRAQAQLDSIQAKLDVIGSDVKVTRDNTDVIKETLEARDAREKAAADAEAKKAKDIDEDPNMYTRAQIMPLGIAPLHYMVFFYSRPPLYPPFVDSQFSIAFHKGSTSWRVDATDKAISAGGELWKINLDEVGDRATICFVAHDRPSGRLKEWMQRYKLTPSTTRAEDVNWVPDGDANMRLTDGGPCDGVTQLREQAPVQTAGAVIPGTPSSSQTPGAVISRGSSSSPTSAMDLYKAQMAQIQQQRAQMLEQVRTMAPLPANFAKITSDGSRRDHVNGDTWQIKVDMQPGIHAQLFDVHMQANLVNASGQLTPLQLSNRQLFGEIEIRYATATKLESKAVMCVTAKDEQRDKSYRLTQWFAIETSRVYWNDSGVQVPGERATFVPAQPATIAEASDAECK